MATDHVIKNVPVYIYIYYRLILFQPTLIYFNLNITIKTEDFLLMNSNYFTSLFGAT